MDTYENIRRLVDCELEKVSKMPELTSQAVNEIGELVDILKDLDEIEHKADMSGYSQRYMSDHMGNSYGYYGRPRMSYNNEMSNVRTHLEKALSEAKSEHEREAIMKMMDEI